MKIIVILYFVYGSSSTPTELSRFDTIESCSKVAEYAYENQYSRNSGATYMRFICVPYLAEAPTSE